MPANAVWQDYGLKFAMEAIRASVNMNCELRLYKNNYSPVKGSTRLNFTATTLPGCGPVSFGTNNFGASAVAANVGDSDAPTITFQVSADSSPGEDIYGWYVLDTVANSVVLAARDPAAPIHLELNGDRYKVTVSLQDQSLNG